MNRIEKIQSYGRRIVYPKSSRLIEAVHVGKLHVWETLVLMDAFWPLEDEAIDYAPKVAIGEANLDVILSTVESGHPSQTSPPRRLVAGVTLVLKESSPTAWKPLLDEEGDPSLVPVDNASIVLFDLAEVDELRAAKELVDESELYARVMNGPVERIGSALAIRCGKGDGAYEIWLGYEPGGQLVQIVIDLELFDDGELE